MIANLLVSFIDAQSKLDHAVDPLGVHSRLLIQGFNLHDSKELGQAKKSNLESKAGGKKSGLKEQHD